MCDRSLPDVPLPSGWASNVKSAVLYVTSLAHYAITCARGWAASSINARVRLAACCDRLRQEAELLREETRIKDTRMAKLDPRRRPHYHHTVFYRLIGHLGSSKTARRSNRELVAGKRFGLRLGFGTIRGSAPGSGWIGRSGLDKGGGKCSPSRNGNGQWQ
jgi:hypothetical protein